MSETALSEPDDVIPVLWFDSKGCGPDELALELRPFPAELDGQIQPSLGLRVRAGALVIGAAGLIDGGFLLHREQVKELHRQLGQWLESPDVPPVEPTPPITGTRELGTAQEGV